MDPLYALSRGQRFTPLFLDRPVSGLEALEELPALNYPAAEEPTAALLHTAFGRLAETGRVAAVSVSTWNPDLDPDGKSEAVSMDLLRTLVGETR